jgi:predicted O-methyltransferase YrrM
MDQISEIEAVQKASAVRPLTEINERECLARLAAEVPDGGTILEIGALYGGTTGVLALAQPKAKVITIDTFEWHPEGDVETSADLLLQNMASIGAYNVEVNPVGDSLVAWQTWDTVIDLLWIDGGHSYNFVFSDLSHFSTFSQVIALHDYDNPFWKTIRQAVEDFLKENSHWYVDEVVGTVAVLRRR